MKNLEILDVEFLKLDVDTSDNFCMCAGHDEDNNIKSLYVCTSDLMVRSFDAKTGHMRWAKDISDHATPDNKPVNVTCLTLQNFLCIGLQNGEMLTVRNGGKRIQPVGVFNSGICAMEWSPDNEMVALVTREMNTCLLSCAFEPMREVNLWDQDFGTKQFINVGWGKKETQFHGSAGKQAAKMKDEYELYMSNDKRVKIAWRGDGVLFAIGFSMDGIRRFKVFDREGTLLYTSEKQPGLESNMSWRPSGNVIATTQKLPDKYTLTFFEKNGLKHGEFTININANTVVEDILWSTDSEVLAIQCKDTEADTQALLLYTIGNYHWYLKQTLNFNSDQKINKALWNHEFDVRCTKILHVCLMNGERYTYTWIGNNNHSVGTTANDDAVLAVIDEKKLLVTGFRHAVVPPPMAALEIPLQVNVLSVHFAPRHAEHILDSNTFFAVTSDHKLIFYELTQKSPLQYQEKAVVQFESYAFPFQFYNWFWSRADLIVCVTVDKNCCYILNEYVLSGSGIVKSYSSHIHASISRIQPHPRDPDILFLQLISGEIMEYQLGSGLKLEPVLCTKEACPSFNVFVVENKLHFVTLTHKDFLHIDGLVVMPSVSSFFVHTDFLLITSLHHVLLCAELTEAGLKAVLECDMKESEHIYKRKIERDAKIVLIVPSDTRTLFQMPRGNLEAIQPRPLSLKIIGKYLDNLKYYDAFDLMRKQRINLNLIYDHDPDKFIENIHVFLELVQNNSWLNLFLTDLENSDVTTTMYSSMYIGKSSKRESNAKIENVCNMVREHINKRSDSDSKILPLITTYVKKNTVEDLEKALYIIKELKIQETGGAKLPVGSDEAIKYLLYMVDVNQLFDVALGMYDFDLVLLVANRSQKDPKEYIPMLNELNEMEENYKRFTINKHLKRFARAVDCLVKCGPMRHGELRTFVKYHSLYRDALSNFSADEEIFKQISEDFGLHLKLKKNFTQAGILYEKAKSYEKAIECYKDALEWEMALKLAHSWPKEQFKELCLELTNSLKDEKRHAEALLILEKYCDDFEASIEYAIECGLFRNALRLCEQQQDCNYKDKKILPALLEETKYIQEQIDMNRSTFIKFRERLFTVRQIKKEYQEAEHEGGVNHNREWDLFSDASTVASSSRSSTRSHRSSKNRRKHERKMVSLKEGSKYEDVALLIHLHALVTSTFEMRLQVKEAVRALCMFDKEKEALFLQNSLEKLLKDMKDSFKDIWTHEVVLEAALTNIAALKDPDSNQQGMHTIEPHLRIPPVIQEINWKLEDLD